MPFQWILATLLLLAAPVLLEERSGSRSGSHSRSSKTRFQRKAATFKHGGADAPDNMQWQTKAEAKAKNRVED